MSPKHAVPLSLEHALLGFLQEQPLHGYEIYQHVQVAQAEGLVWHLKQANLYALLNKLEAKGLVAAERIPQETRPAKRLLHLTVEGRAAFLTWVHQPVAHGRELRLEFLAKLFWAQRLATSTAIDLIAAQRTTCQMWLTDLHAEAASIEELAPYAWLVVQFRIGQIEAMLQWLDTCEAALVPAVLHP
jgi:PadR family transcriptional regulator AphA